MNESEKLHKKLDSEIAVCSRLNLDDILISKDSEDEQDNLVRKTIEAAQCNEASRLFLELYRQSHKEDYYWYGCTLQTYQNTFESRKNEWLDLYIDADVKDFIEEEHNELNFSRTRGFMNDEAAKCFHQSRKKKMEYLRALLDERVFTLKTGVFPSFKNEDSKRVASKDYPEIFKKKEYYELFRIIEKEHVSENKYKVARFSELHSYFKDTLGYITGTDDEYISFIKEVYGVKMSKITPTSNRYDNDYKLRYDNTRLYGVNE